MKHIKHRISHLFVFIIIMITLCFATTLTANADEGALYGEGREITAEDVTLEYDEAVYGEDFESPGVTIDGLVEGIDFAVYDIEVDSIPFPSVAYVTIYGIGNYSGELNIPFFVRYPTPTITVSHDKDTGQICISGGSEVYRSTDKTGEYTLCAKPSGTLFTDTTAIVGKTYYYKVRTIYSSEPRLNSDFVYVSATPVLAKPELTIESVEGSKNIKLSWTAVDYADAYEIWRKVGSSGTYTKYKTTTKTSFTNTSVTAGKKYYYKVRAIDQENSKLNSTYATGYKYCQLPTPTNFKAEYTANGMVELSWDAVKGTYRYEVARTTSTNTDTYRGIEITAKTKVRDDSVSEKSTYYYMVRACSKENPDSGSSEFTALVKVKTTIPGPAIVEVFTIADTNTLYLDWYSSFSGTSEVWKATDKDGPYTRVTTTSKHRYTDKKTTTGKTYYYKIRHVDPKDSSVKSPFVYVTATHQLLPVKGLKTTNVASSGKIKLTWNKRAKADKYIIKRNTKETGTYKEIATTTSTSYIDKTAVAGKLYYYKIYAVYEKNTKANSNAATCNQRCDLARPVVTINNATAGKLKLSWKKVDGAAKYQVWRSTSKNGTYKKIGTTTKKSYTDTSVTSGKTYYYKVKAIHSTKSSANSAYSTVKYAKVK